MESILARALEYTLKYWLKSFTRDQFKLQGRTVQLSNLDLNGDALHASLGLPPALNVTTARVGKLEILLPSVSNVQIEPIVVQIDRLDVVLEENDDVDACSATSGPQTTASSGKGSGYGFADKIADGMTLEVRTVNLLLETHGGAGQKSGSTWASPMASITIRNLLLYTTNECWQAVNLKEARDFSSNKEYIYVFKRLEWESLSIDLLPHPDMFADAEFSCQEGSNNKDDDGAKRVFFGGERFIEGISGQANITVQRTELNSPLGLEVQLHITEAVCPALSEPGLRALLRFFTGLYVCLNRGDIDTNAQQRSAEAAGLSIVSVMVDHIFLCVKDTEFRIELLMQSLLFSRTSVSDGENSRFLTHVRIGGLFLRDTFGRAPCTLVQPSVQAPTESFLHIPEFGKSFCPPIYPLEDQAGHSNDVIPLISLYSLQVKPSPTPPSFATQTVVECQPLMIHLQEDSCLKIASLLADGIVVTPGAVLPDFSVNSFQFNLKGLDITVPLDIGSPIYSVANGDTSFHSSFAGARLHIENLFFSESPSLKLKLLNLEKDAACFSLWKGQPIDASQKKWTAGASLVSLSLETCKDSNGFLTSLNASSGLWRCVELKYARIEVAMTTVDGSPLITIPPPGGLVRAGVACQQYLSNTSVDQLFFVVDLYAYLGRVGDKIAIIGKNNQMKDASSEPFEEMLKEKAPSDSAVTLAVSDLQLRFLESSPADIQGMPLVEFRGEDLSIKVTHRTLGGAIAISSSLCWESVEVNCADTVENFAHDHVSSTSVENGSVMSNESLQLRPVFWVQKGLKHRPNNITSSIPFLDISLVHVIPFREQDMECHSLSLSACVAGVRLGGGMKFTEALLHRFGILGPDGGPGERLCKGLENLSNGPLSKLFKASPLIAHQLPENCNDGSHGDVIGSGFLYLGTPDDVDFSIELKDWLFALEGVQSNAEGAWLDNNADLEREEKCWHTTFKSLLVKAKSTPRDVVNGSRKALGAHPVEVIMVGVEGLQTLKPQFKKHMNQNGLTLDRSKEAVDGSGGVNLEARIVLSEDEIDHEVVQWVVENLRLSVRQPIEAVVTKEELQHLASLCKSEVDSMGRIAAGVLRILRLEGSIGQAAIDQLSNLGTGSFDKLLKADRLIAGGDGGCCPRMGVPLDDAVAGSPSLGLESTVALLEEAILESQASCAAALSGAESSKQHDDEIKRLAEKLETMQSLVMRLRNQI